MSVPVLEQMQVFDQQVAFARRGAEQCPHLLQGLGIDRAALRPCAASAAEVDRPDLTHRGTGAGGASGIACAGTAGGGAGGASLRLAGCAFVLLLHVNPCLSQPR